MNHTDTTTEEWNAIIEHAKKTAEEVGREYFESIHPERHNPVRELHTAERDWIRQALEGYRNEPPESIMRRGIEALIKVHARQQCLVPEWEREKYRKRHNALVLKYIISAHRPQWQIEKKLQTVHSTLEGMLEKGIMELTMICLYAYGRSRGLMKETSLSSKVNSGV